ncbi:hypothetical protein THRCLA_20312 [Thraustotheca clavata]|uniref:Uncharacterized protein n=1 Tax=Thraustotheca clavata TaxID=74557 RepID=A0A1W0A8N1_9STRA|nr:hypothetical protein THRCLA_20312 [Thraustotheca clavata]
MWRHLTSRIGRPSRVVHLNQWKSLSVRWNSTDLPPLKGSIPSNPDANVEEEDLEQKEVESIMRKVLAQSKYFKDHPEAKNSGGLVDMLTGGRLRALEDVQ